MERYEETEWAIETLKEQLNIPIFVYKNEEEMFLKSFYAKKEMLEYEEANDPFRKAAKKMLNTLGHI